MKFIVLLLMFGMNRYWVGAHPLYREEWMVRLRDWCEARDLVNADDPGMRMGWLIGLPFLLCLLVFWIVRDWLFGLVWIAGAAIVFGYSIDISKLGVRIQQHLQWLKVVKTGEDLADAQAYHGRFRKQMVYEEFEGLYPQVFWFALLGPAGALLYRLAGYCAALEPGEEDGDAALSPGDLIQILEWLPARISGLAFAVVGDFNATIGSWVASLSDWRTPTVEVLDRLTRSSMGEEVAHEDDEAQVELTEFILASERDVFHLRDLMGRTLIFWLVLIALFVLLGWS